MTDTLQDAPRAGDTASAAAEEAGSAAPFNRRLDFNHFVAMRKAYIVASSYRCGSTFLCRNLWQTGLLGSPIEMLNPATAMKDLSSRFDAASPADYIAKLIERRTSKNGVFGLKSHFHHFEAFLRQYPGLLDALAPLTFIHIARQDKVAQAVSMAKALQTDQWSSEEEHGKKPEISYDRETIRKCLKDVRRQDRLWRRWFEEHNVTPIEVTYEELTADPARVVRGIVEHLGVQHDEPDPVDVPSLEKQGDETNEEWVERFRRERRALVKRRRQAAEAEPAADPAVPHFFDRHAELIKSLPIRSDSGPGSLETIRRRYDRVFMRNRDLFANARVLDLMSAQGFWSVAALDAGAAHVVAVERSERLIQIAERNLAESGVDARRYRLVQSAIFPALQSFMPEAFDVIICKEFFEQCHPSTFFRHLARLRPKHVVLDTRIINGAGPVSRFGMANGSRAILSTPSHDLIKFLCQGEFTWRLADWQSMGSTNWSGVKGYARERTYLLDRVR
ncbi:MAG TPA: Stf0 family sulfotransferase [Stellaceae bacterium]|nr:Stf0 family sulfotransferase [Stellaceae bacterium]